MSTRTHTLWPLTRPQLQALSAAQPAPAMPGAIEADALPPPFVAARSMQLADADVPLPWSTSFLILRTADGMVVGACGFKNAPVAGLVEVGYGVAPAARGQGAATVALQTLVDLAFQAGATEVLAEVLPDNHASSRVALKAGFSPVGSRLDEEGAFVVQWSRRRDA